VRIDVLSELPEEWEREVSRWMRLNKNARAIVDGEPAPDRNDEYRFYQLLVGAWPVDGKPTAEVVERLQACLIKSIKEAKRRSSWINPFEPYENAAKAFVDAVLTGRESAKFLPAFVPFQERVARAGMVNSLSQVALKIASPGVPDFYQGTELWDLNLVDPDNRRPVDFEARERMLLDVDRILAEPPETRGASLTRLLQHWKDGAIKLLVAAAGLRLRSAEPRLFLEGDYMALETETPVPARAVAFARTLGSDDPAGGRAAILIAPHLVATALAANHPLPVGDVWKTSRVHLPLPLASLTYRDVFTGAEAKIVRVENSAWMFIGQVLNTMPVALLVSVSP
jgi:(1->4)-alpha-D-glucan 1-alpha-D-glucosylmutase